MYPSYSAARGPAFPGGAHVSRRRWVSRLVMVFLWWWVGAARADESVAEPKEGGYGERWIVVPAAFYSQETTLGAVAFGSGTFSLRDDAWPSTLTAALVGTLQRQATFTVWPTLFFGPDSRWTVNGRYILAHFPMRYYGLGPDADPTYQTFTRRWLLTETSILRRVSGPLYAGLVDQFTVVEVQDISPAQGDHPLGSGEVPGEAGGVVHGLGARIRWEHRDNPQSARNGTYADLRWLGFGGALGSDYAYTETVWDGRAYHTVGADTTFAGQMVLEARSGTPPFTNQAELGGDNVLRGLYRGRFRDRSLLAVQGEVRIPLVWRFRAVLFAGVGEVFSEVRTLGEYPPRWTAGGGLRYELDPDSHTTVRLDIGAGPNGAGVIFNFGEAF